jgi:hypothetical protein
MSYKCSGCDYTAYYLTSIKNHINKKNKCSDDLLYYETVNTIKCDSCSCEFSDKCSLTKHLRVCKENLVRENKIKDEKIKNLESKLKLDKIKNKNKITTINNGTIDNSNSNSNNTYNIMNVNLTSYNDPNMEGTEVYMKKALRRIFMSVPNLVRDVHFNEKYPENHNICITNKRTKDARVYDGKRWVTINKSACLLYRSASPRDH